MGAVDADKVYKVAYHATLDPKTGMANASITIDQPRRLVRSIELVMPSERYTNIGPASQVEINGDTVTWRPQQEGSVLRYDFVIDINLKGTIYGTKLVSEQMVKQKSGHIINIASMAGISPVSGLNLYSTSKFGVRGFTLSIANELQEHNVAVTVVCPDLVDTPMLTLQLDYPEAALTFSGSRHLTVEEIGQVILDQGLKKKKLEIVYPAGRGLTAKIASFQPRMANLILKKLTEKGLKRQKELKEK